MTVLALEPHSDDVVLFASFLAQQHQARVVTVLESHVQAARGLPITQAQRLAENRAAMRELGLELEQWPFRDDAPAWGAIEDSVRALDHAERPRLVLAPAVEDGGHEHHSALGEICVRVFGDRLQPYLTYRRGHGRSEGRPVPFAADMLVRKLRALSCFRTQIEELTTRAWFIGDQREWVPT